MVAPAVSTSLCTLFNTSLRTGKFPFEWKLANVTPVPKSGDHQIVSNYRPISVIPVIAKVFEALIHHQVYEYMQAHNLLTHAQSGFRPGHSTQDVLLKSIDDWKIALDRDMVVGSLFIDLSKAFDSIDHNLLLSKLESYGVHVTELLWFTDYLEGRKQRVVLEGQSADWSEVTRGVPQGTILGPLLFIIFVNDLPDVVQHSTINLYADDTTIYMTDRDPLIVGEKLSADLQRVAAWIGSNGLKMNITKTQAMVLSRKRRRSQEEAVRICLDGQPISKQKEVNYLGVVMDQNLSWVQHVEKVRRRSLAGLATIRRASAYLPSSTRRLLYNALVLPHLDYCSTVWHSCSKASSDRVERVQNYAMRIILKKPPRTSSEALCNDLGWTTLHVRRHKAMLYQVHRCLHKRAPTYLCNKFFTNAEFGYQRTRGGNKLHLLQPNTNYYKTTFEFQGAKSFNSLPSRIRSLSSAVTFKSSLQSVLSCFYLCTLLCV